MLSMVVILLVLVLFYVIVCHAGGVPPPFEVSMSSLFILVVNYRHNIIKQCEFVHVDPQIITMGCPNLVQRDSD